MDKSVEVRLLISWWPHSKEEEKVYLRSLVELSNIHNVNISAVSIGCVTFSQVILYSLLYKSACIIHSLTDTVYNSQMLLEELETLSLALLAHTVKS